MSILTITTDLIDNDAWLAGYSSFEEGHGCPWGNDSARAGWIRAKADAAALIDEEGDR